MYVRIVLLLLFVSAGPARAQADLSFLTTRAEASGYQETTRYDEAMAFLEVLAAASDRLYLTQVGYTTEGRPIPLMVYGDVEGARPEAIKASDKLRIYIQGNIHAGEVAGKEAALMLLRGLAAGQQRAWADSLVLLVAPLYNADGNEQVSLYNRPLQHGPVGGMGERENAQGLDLNRDHMKLDAPETRSLARMLAQYDPHVLIDLHTTNGTHHGYHLTYAPPLHPNTYGPLVRFLREAWLPSVTEAVDARYGWDLYYYGNLPPPGAGSERGWYTFDHRPRFSSNYAGLRGRFGILSEAYAYAPFEERVLATLYFLREVLGFAYRHASEIERLVDQADAASVVGARLALRARHARSEQPVEILLGEVTEEQNPYTGEPMLRRKEVRVPEPMYEYGTFGGTEWERAPEAYLVPADLAPAVDRLQAHGVAFAALEREQRLPVARFRIDSTLVAERPYQGRSARTLYGEYEEGEAVLPAGTLVVPVDQPLGRLAFALLEPRSDDGLVSWGLLDDALQGSHSYPIYHLPADTGDQAESGK